MRAESWEWVIFEKMAFVGKKWKQLMKCSGWVKKYSQSKQLWEDGLELEPRILKRMEQDWEKILLRSSKSENDDEKHHHELLRHSGIIKTKRLSQRWKDFDRSWRRHLTDDKSFLRQTLKRIWEYLRENKKSQVRSWGKTCGLRPTEKKHRRTI